MPRLAIEDCGFYCYTLSGWRTGGSGFRSCPQDKRFLSENGDTPSPHRTHPCGVFPKNTQKSGAVRRFFVCVNYAIHLAQQRAATRGIRNSDSMSRSMGQYLCAAEPASLQHGDSALVTERTVAFLLVFTQSSPFYDILFRKLFRALFLILMGCNRTSEEDYLGRKE